ncbi:MAG: ornithine carbamoyltransferase [Bacillota bacterium]|nr:ornithine carbamoyltransferase [Bacillota bacterium]HHU62284.1 ornithine carbamoyltransferase [Natronincola sp.]
MAELNELLNSSLGNSFKGKDFLTLQDYTTEELLYILKVAKSLKLNRLQTVLSGKTLGMIFAKSSTRTRVSFEVGIYQLGGMPLFLNTQDIQLGRGETVADTARVLSRYLDGIMIRTFAQDDVEQLAKWGSIPVINGLTDEYHPCQAMADYLTILERFNKLEGLKIAYIGDGNNVANSLMIGAAKFGLDFSIACPEGFEPPASLVSYAKEVGKDTGSNIEIVREPKDAVKGASAVYTDVWVSMGQEEEMLERKRIFSGYQINNKLMGHANDDAIILHCLPAHKGEEISEEAMEGLQSAVFDQAENRLHVQKAIMALVMRD